jgi:ParB-like chromosome segregation protein Spo0J
VTRHPERIEQRAVEKLIPYARNSRTHSDAQVAQIAASIKEWGWTTPILIDETEQVIAGHGRLMAARKLGMAEVPVIVAAGWTDAQKRAYVIADNKLALNAGWDENLLKLELQELGELNFDLNLTGFTLDEIGNLFDEGEELTESEENYSRKIEAPIYEITGEKPKVSQLLDRARTQELQKEIEAATLPDDVKQFLMLAAERHTIFNFRNIAEYYAHSSVEIQQLMERSALVIIDFNKAVEEGFVDLTNQVKDIYMSEHGDA